jgi:hypothetical protein
MRTRSLSTFLKNWSYWSRLTVIRWQLFAFLLVGWGLMAWLEAEYKQDDSNLWLVMHLFTRFVAYAIIGLIVISIGSAGVAWMIFRAGIKRHAITLQTRFGDGHRAEAGWVPLTISLTGRVLRPILGTVQASLIFSDKRITQRIVLDENIRKPKQLWRIGILGSGSTFLHDRGIYDVDKVSILFCDMLGLVAIPVIIPFTRQLYTLPVPMPPRKVKAQPNSAEEQKHRIEIPRRVEGEYVNYKEFETGDNIQRIVWKIYAKSGQLVVRIPETKDPYASHLYLYASYFHGFGSSGGAFETELLNVYKDQLRNLYEALLKNGYDVRLPHDQEIPKLAGVSEKKNELYQIAACSWQAHTPPSVLIKPQRAAFVCITSFTPAAELEVLIGRIPDIIPIVVLRLSHAIPSPFQFSLQEIFFRPERTPADELSRPWLLSSLRRDLIRNEKEMEQLLRKRNNSWITDVMEFQR